MAANARVASSQRQTSCEMFKPIAFEQALLELSGMQSLSRFGFVAGMSSNFSFNCLLRS